MSTDIDLDKFSIEDMQNIILKKRAELTFYQLNKVVHEMEKHYFDLNEESLLKVANYLECDKRKNVKGLSKVLLKFFKSTESEIERVEKMYKFDRRFSNCIYIAGVDEVGRGPLAGPIAAGAVVFNMNYKDQKELVMGIKDSKKLSAKKREEISDVIKSKAVTYNISIINNDEIDKKGIAWCNNEVLKRAVRGLKVPVDFVLSDGYAVNNLDIDNEFIVKGDSKSASIAAGSIIAKVYRDNLMKEYHKVYPQYNFLSNSGYGTKEHIDAIKKYGICKLHRLSFLKNII
ncbi:ribonuclease HII [Clostridium tyrobutyricum]|jgi:ribonuclease HII|uniref:Ribonuclease HII n=2 Tax=Clostridium tyrobutyricum TaxID=1519 RepID=W6NDT5_CLOTY|nr:ribonuclease HII [Clostridium tyrobutyricum]ANP69619.1 ribonuclease HII [Clostridium tyrobutyricum]QCH27556.1 Ribonuclease HII [Clostridium tyrobutyricum]QNB66019.1 ribonuclease HII [Clostridium tyrobutyricum]CDL90152.1 Ribonuclease HII [Clostridium tyrobutyricum DIVETGP]